MSTTKLHINLNQGLIDVEGDEAFVREVFESFKSVLAERRGNTTDDLPGEEVIVGASSEAPSKTQQKSKKRRPRKQQEGTESRSGWGLYSPQLDNSLTTTNLKTFFEKSKAKSHADKILTFVRFLSDELSITPCTADQVYTCYKVLREKMPEAFAQAFRDTQNKQKYIDAASPAAITATIVGDNRFEDMIKE
ncbi:MULTISPECIES: hypothetical protein [unclassified Rhizobium]|uniref:hypothetical protein n=1 Tax=unclassified Rhizobium TaxID=2613769 RepID=UPI00247AB787|nr:MULTISPECIES: hypothetical protein [unclassified Rhizobium]MDH7800482.1 hypothetical protein [Rhizobium sp. AN70]